MEETPPDWWFAGMSDQEFNCALIRNSPLDLRSTMLLMIVTLVCAFFARLAVVHLIWRYKWHKGLEKGDPACPFPSWEVAVFVCQVQGVSEATGAAIASGCRAYEIAGAVVLFVLLVAISFFFSICYYALHLRPQVVWVHVKFKQGWWEFKRALSCSVSMSKTKRGLLLFHSLEHMIRRGEWEERPHPANRGKQDMVHGRFHRHWCPLFDFFHGRAWCVPPHSLYSFTAPSFLFPC